MTPDEDLGQRPHPNKLPCFDCDHVWFEGERRHHYVDATDGQESIEDGAIVVCVLCKQQRRHPRGDERFEW